MKTNSLKVEPAADVAGPRTPLRFFLISILAYDRSFFKRPFTVRRFFVRTLFVQPVKTKYFYIGLI